jgi:hypothetical protein
MRSNRISQLDRLLMGEDCEKSHTGLRGNPHAVTPHADHSHPSLDARNFAPSCGISPTVSLAYVEKAAFWLVVEFDTGWHNDCSEGRKKTAEIKRSTFAARRQEC